MPGSTADRQSADISIHPLDPEDTAITAAMRAMLSSAKGVSRGIEARGQFDALMESVLPLDDVTFEADSLGGIPGISRLSKGRRAVTRAAHARTLIHSGRWMC